MRNRFAHVLATLAVPLLMLCSPTTAQEQPQEQPAMSEQQAFFDSLDLDLPELAQVKAAAARSDWPAAKQAFVEHLKTRRSPRWHFDWRDRTAKGHHALPEELRDAERYARDELLSVSVWHDFGDELDWNANPMPNQYAEWTWQLNRHRFWETLGKAYWATGDERYAQAFVRQMTDWVRSQPRPEHSGNKAYSAWRTIETGIRTFSSWPNAFFYFLSSPSFDDESIVLMVASFAEHARHLMRHPQTANWLTMECNGLYHVGVLFPEFKESAEWRKTALDRLYEELDRQVYPDGAQIELSSSYHTVALNSFEGPVRLAQLNDRPLPDGYIEKLERMYDFVLLISMPNRYLPPLNDSGHSHIRSLMERASGYFPTRDDYRWMASGGRDGAPPAQVSHAFPYAGYLVMRSGWDEQARYLLLDVGPFGYSHQHEDKLSIIAAAYGRVHLIDPGMFHYDDSPQRRYHIDTFAHNTVMVDGLPQRRRGEKNRWNYVVKEPLPHRFVTSDSFEYAAGTYDEGYGDEKLRLATHRREVVYIKSSSASRAPGEYWIVVDTLIPNDDQPHSYDAMFHLDADDIDIGDDLSVITRNKSGSNLAIVPLANAPLSVTNQAGQEEPFVQGWAWQGAYDSKAVPTPVYRAEASGTVTMVFVLYPLREGEALPLVGIRRIDGGDENDGMTLAIDFADHGSDHVVIRCDAEQPVSMKDVAQ